MQEARLTRTLALKCSLPMSCRNDEKNYEATIIPSTVLHYVLWKMYAAFHGEVSLFESSFIAITFHSTLVNVYRGVPQTTKKLHI